MTGAITLAICLATLACDRRAALRMPHTAQRRDGLTRFRLHNDINC
jgi:hypothetical protein